MFHYERTKKLRAEHLLQLLLTTILLNLREQNNKGVVSYLFTTDKSNSYLTARRLLVTTTR